MTNRWRRAEVCPEGDQAPARCVFDSNSLLIAVQISANMYGRRVEMQKTKLTVRVPRDLLENVKRYAQQNNTTLTALIEAYLRRIPPQEPFDDAPIVRRLSGSLSQDVTLQDHKEHLVEKYGR
jgi:hypothetical protein